MSVRLVYDGLNTRNCRDLHQDYLYEISDSMIKPHKLIDYESDRDPEQETNFKYKPPGLYVIDLPRLFEGKLERYKLVQTIGGVCNHMDVN